MKYFQSLKHLLYDKKQLYLFFDYIKTKWNVFIFFILFWINPQNKKKNKKGKAAAWPTLRLFLIVCESVVLFLLSIPSCMMMMMMLQPSWNERKRVKHDDKSHDCCCYYCFCEMVFSFPMDKLEPPTHLLTIILGCCLPTRHPLLWCPFHLPACPVVLLLVISSMFNVFTYPHATL